jgi:hypothetical protein
MPREAPARYQALVDFLSHHAGESVVMTYAEIEAIIGASLPLSARLAPTWWTTASQMHVRILREHGWQARLEQRDRRVRFTRDGEDG